MREFKGSQYKLLFSVYSKMKEKEQAMLLSYFFSLLYPRLVPFLSFFPLPGKRSHSSPGQLIEILIDSLFFSSLLFAFFFCVVLCTPHGYTHRVDWDPIKPLLRSSPFSISWLPWPDSLFFFPGCVPPDFFLLYLSRESRGDIFFLPFYVLGCE